MAKSVESADKKKNSIFSKEVFGMALILFSVLCFLCLFIGDSIYPVGTFVRGFLLGIFGYYSMVFLVLMLLLGIKLVIGHSVFPKQVRMFVFMLNVTILVIFQIIHITINMKGSLPLAERLNFAFGNCTYNLTNSTAGGAIFSLIAHPLLQLLRPLGAYILLSVIGIICVLYFVNKINFPSREKGERGGGRRKNSAPETPQLGGQQPVMTNSGGLDDQAIIPQNRSPLFIWDGDSRGRKGKKQSPAPMVVFPFFAGNPYGGAQPIQQQPIQQPSQQIDTSRTYGQSYDDDFQSKVDFIKTPQKPDVSSLRSNPNGYTAGVNDSYRRDYDRSDDESFTTITRTNIGDSRRETIADIQNHPSSGAYQPIFDRAQRPESPRVDDNNITSREPQRDIYSSADRSSERANSSTDRFFGADFSAKERLLNNQFGEQDTADIDASANSQSSKVYNPYSSGTGNVSRDSASESSRENPREMPREISREMPREMPRGESGRNNLADALTRGRAPQQTAERAVPSYPETNSSVDSVSTATPPVEEVKTPEKVVKKKPTEEEKYSIENMPSDYQYKAPPLSLLEDYRPTAAEIQEEKRKQQARADVIVRTFGNRGIEAKVEDVIVGPTVTRFVVSVPQDVSMKSVSQAQPDLDVWLETITSVRMLIPIPGTSKIGIEVANARPSKVGLREILSTEKGKTVKPDSTAFALGKNIIGDPIMLDIRDMPHAIVAGATGTGKSVCLNSMLISLLYRYGPDELRLVIVDPKEVEFTPFENIPHLMFKEIITKPNKANAMLDWATKEMDQRYSIFRDAGVRNLVEYNKKAVESGVKKMPYILILIDEFNDLMLTAGDKKKVEEYVTRLAQKARAAGISLIFATQRPSADVIDGSIKTNFASRICFQTSTNVDSQVVIGKPGAETLLGKGDVFYKTSKMPVVERAQGAFIDTPEVFRVTDYIRKHNVGYYDYKALEYINNAEKETAIESSGSAPSSGKPANTDPNQVEDVYKKALRLVIMTRNVSKTSLQSKLGVGYPKAAKIIDWMEEEGFISEQIDNKQRSIFITREIYESRFGPFEESWR